VDCEAANRCPSALTRALARRDRHRERSLHVRALPLTAVAALVAASVELFLHFGFLPPLLVPALVALLALEFRWAARVLAWGLERLGGLTDRLRRIFQRR
jgi:hypothetical protein